MSYTELCVCRVMELCEKWLELFGDTGSPMAEMQLSDRMRQARIRVRALLSMCELTKSGSVMLSAEDCHIIIGANEL